MRAARLLFMLLLLAGTASAQVWLNPTCEWRMWATGSGPVTKTNSSYRYYINGDTILNTKYYYKVFRQGVDSTFNLATGAFMYRDLYNEYAVALREDAQAMRFYGVFRNQAQEETLANFRPSDIIAGTPSYAGCTPPQTTLQSDIVYLGTEPRVRYTLQGSYARLIEGVGSEAGLFEHHNMCLFFESATYLLCYRKDNRVLAVNSLRDCGMTPGVPNCQASFCYSLRDSSNVRLAVFQNTSQTHLPGDTIALSFIFYGDGMQSTFAPMQPHQYWAPGNYTVRVQIVTAAGCTSIVDVPIVLGNTCLTSAVNGVEAGAAIAVYPSPARTGFRVGGKLPPGARIELFDATGRKLRVQDFAAGSFVPRNGLPAGLYHYRVLHRGTVAATGRILFQ